MNTVLINQFVVGLKSRQPEVRAKAAQELSLYVKSELREATPDEINSFMDEFNHHIFEMVSANDVSNQVFSFLLINQCVNIWWTTENRIFNEFASQIIFHLQVTGFFYYFTKNLGILYIEIESTITNILCRYL